MAPKTTPQAAPQDEARKPMPMPEGGWPADEFTGKAGRFERDPFTGVRRRVEEPTQPKAPGADGKSPA